MMEKNLVDSPLHTAKVSSRMSERTKPAFLEMCARTLFESFAQFTFCFVLMNMKMIRIPVLNQTRGERHQSRFFVLYFFDERIFSHQLTYVNQAQRFNDNKRH